MEAPNKRPIGIEEAADFLMVSTSYLYKLTSEKAIPHYKPGRRILFLESELLDFMKENSVRRKSDQADKEAEQKIRSKAAKYTMGIK